MRSTVEYCSGKRGVISYAAGCLRVIVGRTWAFSKAVSRLLAAAEQNGGPME